MFNSLNSHKSVRHSILVTVGIITFCFLLIACTSGSADAGDDSSDGPARECTIQGFSCYPRVGKSDTISLVVNPKLRTAIASVTATFATSDCSLSTSKVYLGYVPGGADILLDFKCSGSLPKKIDGVLTITYAFEKGEPTRSVGAVHIVTS